MFDCALCHWDFPDQDAADTHMTEYSHWIPCRTCDQPFRSVDACNQHMNDLEHWVPIFSCDTCDDVFNTRLDADQHMNDMEHWASTYGCGTCDDLFDTRDDAEEHFIAFQHCPTICQDCAHETGQESNFHADDQNVIICPFCHKDFLSASGASAHLERGSCPNADNWDRNSIRRAIRRYDPGCIISIKKAQPVCGKKRRYTSTALAFNGVEWACSFCVKTCKDRYGLDLHLNSVHRLKILAYLRDIRRFGSSEFSTIDEHDLRCSICQKPFKTQKELNAHMKSGTHKSEIYHCANHRSGCDKEFPTLAGMLSHLESESCGDIPFDNVVRYYQGLNGAIRGCRRIPKLKV